MNEPWFDRYARAVVVRPDVAGTLVDEFLVGQGSQIVARWPVDARGRNG